jgi:hypothetical protein
MDGIVVFAAFSRGGEIVSMNGLDRVVGRRKTVVAEVEQSEPLEMPTV